MFIFFDVVETPPPKKKTRVIWDDGISCTERRVIKVNFCLDWGCSFFPRYFWCSSDFIPSFELEPTSRFLPLWPLCSLTLFCLCALLPASPLIKSTSLQIYPDFSVTPSDMQPFFLPCYWEDVIPRSLPHLFNQSTSKFLLFR